MGARFHGLECRPQIQEAASPARAAARRARAQSRNLATSANCTSTAFRWPSACCNTAVRESLHFRIFSQTAAGGVRAEAISRSLTESNHRSKRHRTFSCQFVPAAATTMPAASTCSMRAITPSMSPVLRIVSGLGVSALDTSARWWRSPREWVVNSGQPRAPVTRLGGRIRLTPPRQPEMAPSPPGGDARPSRQKATRGSPDSGRATVQVRKNG